MRVALPNIVKMALYAAAAALVGWLFGEADAGIVFAKGGGKGRFNPLDPVGLLGKKKQGGPGGGLPGLAEFALGSIFGNEEVKSRGREKLAPVIQKQSPAQPAGPTAAEVAEAEERRRRSRRTSTILTGTEGILGQAPIQRKTLLGA